MNDFAYKRIELDVWPGAEITRVITAAQKIAKDTNCNHVCFRFNGVDVEVTQYATLDYVYNCWQEELNRPPLVKVRQTH